jgi:outer membrane lipoprotein-sorting protein
MSELLRSELTALTAATPAEQVARRESVLNRLDKPAKRARADHALGRQRRRIWLMRLSGGAAALILALLAVLMFPPGANHSVSAAEIVDRAWAAVEGQQGMSGVLHWEGEWSQRFPSGDQITRTFEIWFDFDDPGRYRLTQRDPEGWVFNEMVRDGVDHMWQLSRTGGGEAQGQAQVTEIILSPEEMRELGSWYVPSPFLDDLDRFTQVLDTVEKVAETEVAGRPAYVLQGRLYGFGRPGEGKRIEPVTSTVQLIVDSETYWVLGRDERLPRVEAEQGVFAGIVQRTRQFEILAPDQVPSDTFGFDPPPGAEVRTVEGIAGYYAPSPDAIGLEEAAALTSFTLVLPAELPEDLHTRPFFRFTGPGQAGTFGIVYLGDAGRQAFLLEYAQAQPLGRAARLVAIGEKQGWLVPDPIDGHKFSLYLIDPEPTPGPDRRPWPGGVELQVWGLSLEEAAAMLASLEPYPAGATGE